MYAFRERNNLYRLGHKKRRLKMLGQKGEENDKYSYPAYVSHLLESESIDFVRMYRKKYWGPFEQAISGKLEAVA